MQRPAGIIFDLGGTVLNEETFNAAAGSKRLLELADNSRQLTVEDVRRADEEMYSEIYQLQEETMFQFSWHSWYRLLYENLGISFSLSSYELEREFWRAATKFAPADGIFNVLDTLEKHRIKTGILSNTFFSGVVLEEELARHDLARRFSFVVSSSDYGFRKPHSRIFQIALRKMNLEPQDVWFVGDKLEYDIRGAIDSGLYPVWYNPESKPGEMDGEYLEVKSWREFHEKIEALCSR